MSILLNFCTPYYDNQYPVFSRQDGAVAANIAILHPNIYYFVLNASWSSYNSQEFWNKGNTDVTVNNNPVKKTIYSPSPTSYVEAKSSAFTGFASNGLNVSGGFNKGWNFYGLLNGTGTTVFFPALGYRDIWSGHVGSSTGGAISDVSAHGYSWSAGPSGTSTYARHLYFNSGGVAPQAEDGRAYGFAVLSVSE